MSAHNEELLERLYGDWRRIPTPEERACKEHAQIVDLDCSWEQYIEQQKSMDIHTYSRSIR